MSVHGAELTLSGSAGGRKDGLDARTTLVPRAYMWQDRRYTFANGKGTCGAGEMG